MDEENEQNRRKELLESFRKSLSKPLSERYFDEDTLIEIFDYAGDMGDDYLRFEVLLCAARFYPDSPDLQERHAIFYSQRSPESLDRYLEDNPTTRGMIWDILRVSSHQPRGEEAVRSLDYLLETYEDFTDEETIQLVNLANDIDCYDWLTANFARIREKVEYLPVLLYEASVVAELNGDIATALQLMEEITDSDPFNAYYWLRMAILSSGTDTDKALSAIEYSLAIEPDNVQAQLTKGNLLYAKEKDTKTLQPLAAEIFHNNPDDVDAAKFYAMIFAESGNVPAAREALQDMLDRHPDTAPRIVPDLLGFQPENMDELLDLLYEMSDDRSELLWNAWMEQALNNGFHHVAARMHECYMRNAGICLSLRFKIEDLFVEGRYADVVQAVENYITGHAEVDTDYPVLITMHLVSLVKIGEFDKARDLCELLERMSQKFEFCTVRGNLDFLALRMVYRQVHALVSNGAPTPEAVRDFNPITISSRNLKDKK